MDTRYHGWALFFGTCIAAIGAYVFRLTSQRVPPDRLGMVLGLAALIAGGRFLFGGLTGRIPSWMVTFIDADK